MLVRIDVDSENTGAREAYESWGSEHYKHFKSQGGPYATLDLRPLVEGA